MVWGNPKSNSWKLYFDFCRPSIDFWYPLTNFLEPAISFWKLSTYFFHEIKSTCHQKSTLGATEINLYGWLQIFWPCQLTLAPYQVIIGGYNLKIGSIKLNIDSFPSIEADHIPVEGSIN